MEQMNSLWPGLEETGLGTLFQPLFLLSYGLGLAVLMWVSWHRLFNELYTPRTDRLEKVLQLMPPGDLRGTLTVLRAYAVYCLLMGGLYSLVALAGSVLWDLADKLQIAGVAGLPDRDSLPVKMDDPAWPLAVSLVFVGVVNHVPKLRQVELTFRRWAYRSIGIPPFIRQRTSEVLAIEFLDHPEAAAANDRVESNARVEDRAAPHVGADRAAQLRKALDRTAILYRLLMDGREPWPSMSLKTRFEPLLVAIRAEARDLFAQADGIGILIGGEQAEPGTEAAALERTERRRLFDGLEERTLAVHRELCAFVAVCIENEPMPEDGTHPILRKIVDRVHEAAADNAGATDRLLTIALSVLGISLLGSWLAAERGFIPSYAGFGPFGTALAETALMLAVTVPAILVALATRDSLMRVRRWRPWRRSANGSYPVSQYVKIHVVTALASLPLIVLYYGYQLVVTGSTGGTAIWGRLLDWIPIYVVYSTIAGLLGVACAFVVGDVEGGDESAGPALRAALVVAVAVSGIMVGAGLYFDPGIYEGGTLAFLWDNFAFVTARMALLAALVTYLLARTTEQEDEDAIGAERPRAAGEVAA